MIDENKDYITKPKLPITVKTLSKYNGRNVEAANETNKQTQKHRNWQTFRQKNKKTYLQIDTQVDLLWTQANTEINKIMKNEILRSDVIEINK